MYVCVCVCVCVHAHTHAHALFLTSYNLAIYNLWEFTFPLKTFC